MSEEIDPLQIRAWTYERLRQGKNGSQDLQLIDLALHVRGKAVQTGVLSQVPYVANYNIPPSIGDAVRELIWELVIQGIVVPGTGLGGGSGDPGLPFFRVTKWGKSCLDAGEFSPHDTGEFIQRLRIKAPAVEPLVLLYAAEALNSFRAGTFLGSAIMIGVASEAVLVSLRGAVQSALDSPPKKEKFRQSTTGTSVKRLYDEIQKRLDPVMAEINADLKTEDISSELSGIFGLIRKTRNDAGHPTGRTIEREEAFALLQLFPSYCKVAYNVIDWLTTRPI